MSQPGLHIKAIKVPSAPADGVALFADFAALQMRELCGSKIAVEDIDQFAASSEQAASATGDEFWDNPSWARYRPYRVVDGVLIVPVKGALYADLPATLGSYATGYEYISRAVERGAADGNVKSICLDIDSPGGMVKGTSECAAAIAKAGKVKPVVVYAETAASAAYWIASQASKITMAETGQVGSIGVITAHFDYSEYLANAGIKYTPIFAGERKTDGSPYLPLSPEAKASIQKRIDTIYSIFVKSVAAGRGLDEKTVRGTQAEVYGSEQAVSMGLADAVSSRADFFSTPSAGVSDQPNENENDEENAVTDQTKPEAKTYADGMADASARIFAILGSAEAKGREDLAKVLAADASISAETAAKILAASPVAAPAATETAPAKPEAGSDAAPADFSALMKVAGSPQVGASTDTDANAKDDSDPDGQAALIISMFK